MEYRRKQKQASAKKLPTWDLTQLYKSPSDPKIEVDLDAIEDRADDFSKKYGSLEKKLMSSIDFLHEALVDYEAMKALVLDRAILYLYFFRDIDAANSEVSAKIGLVENRLAHTDNKVLFFQIALAKIPRSQQKKVLSSEKLKHFNFFLKTIFDEAKHMLSVPEEKILNLKAVPSHNLWVSSNEKLLNSKSIVWKGKTLPVPEASSLIANLKTQADRSKLAAIVAAAYKQVAPMSEAELNAIATNKKIDDELRGFKTPYESTFLSYKNDPEAVNKLVQAVSDNYPISHRFYKLKSKLLKLSKLNYSDRAAKIGTIKTRFSFDECTNMISKLFGELNPKFAVMLRSFVRDRRIDAEPRIGKRAGAYCWGSFTTPTFVMLNHVSDLRSYSTYAHEMGHSIHSMLSRQANGPLYSSYSMSLAETASTLFETLAFEAVFDRLSDKEKVIALHDRINEDIATVFRQIACFNYEKDIHSAVRTKGYVTKEELADMHNKNMSAYLGPDVKMEHDDGYSFVSWMHLRYFFYVYSYAYGMLVTKALLRRYKKDKSFWKKIEQFLSAGGKDTPENILKEIGIDVSKPDFWMEGLKEIEDDIRRLENLTSGKVKK